MNRFAIFTLATLISASALANDPPATTTVTGGAPGGADITMARGAMVIGGQVGGKGGHAVSWGKSVTLTEQDSAMQSNGSKCAFNITYWIKEGAGIATSSKFVNRIKVDGSNVVAVNTALSLPASGIKEIRTQVYLPNGSHKLAFALDDDSSVSEMNEANNYFPVSYTLTCGKK